MKPFTVLLLYPDYIAGSFGHDTVLEYCQALNPKKAIRAVQEQFAKIHNTDPNDWYCLACFKGKHFDLNPGGGKLWPRS